MNDAALSSEKCARSLLPPAPGPDSRSTACSVRRGPWAEDKLPFNKRTNGLLPDLQMDEFVLAVLTILADDTPNELRGPSVRLPLAQCILRLVGYLAMQPLLPGGEPREALAAAFAARSAALDGNAARVDAFSREWLGLAHPERWREAVEMALLSDWTSALPAGAADDAYVSEQLRRRARTEHTRLRPLWERGRFHGRRTALFSEPLRGGGTVEDLVADGRTPETEALFTELADSRIAAVIWELRTQEGEQGYAVAWNWASAGEGWAQAAADAGLPEAYGERIRRKLKRLGQRQTARDAARKAGVTCS
ncbi:hypothetical protein [Streptomyces sp. NPDC017949]|uniref:hypothetical protein n=1 Tax=Streptomyces sp. NPDC017949 TaxID=3365020 RepID=UPI0037A937DF